MELAARGLVGKAELLDGRWLGGANQALPDWDCLQQKCKFSRGVGEILPRFLSSHP